MAARGHRPAQVGGDGAIRDRDPSQPVGDAPLPASPLPAGPDHRPSSGRARAPRAAVPQWPAGKMTDPVGALRDPRLALPDPWTNTSRPAQGDYPWSPSGGGTGPQDSCAGTRQGRARRGRACPQDGDGRPRYHSDRYFPNATPPPRKGRHGREELPATPRDGVRAFRRGVPGTARPSRTCATKSAPRSLGADRTVGLSTRSTSTPRLFDLVLGTVTSMSSVWTTASSRSAERSRAGCWSCRYATTGGGGRASIPRTIPRSAAEGLDR
jgi:hypothetical protein